MNILIVIHYVITVSVCYPIDINFSLFLPLSTSELTQNENQHYDHIQVHRPLISKLVQSQNQNYRFHFPNTRSMKFNGRMGKMDHDQTLGLVQKEMVQSLGMNTNELRMLQDYRDANGIDHFYSARQVHNITVVNHRVQLLVKDGEVVSFASSANDEYIAPKELPKEVISLEQAIEIGRKQYGGQLHTIPPKKVYVEKPDQTLSLAHQFQLIDKTKPIFCQVSIDVTTGQIVQYVNFVSKATYKVIKLPKINPSQGFEEVKNPEYLKSSPFGWNSNGKINFTDTESNNVIVSHNGKKFKLGTNADFDPSKEPDDKNNMIASGINLFYVANYMHDVFYQYGFTEKTGNFQSVNTDGKGVGGDAVTIEVQSDDGTNNANFLTPPDGQSGHMNMFRFDGFTPNRDSGLANDVVMHEYGHGISSRLTGGSRQANCLGETESAGMGEGWSDAFAVYLTRTVADKRDLVVKLAEYLTPDKKGFRIFPYSTDMKVNPHTYESLMDTKERVHHIGEIWAVMLYELYWNLVDKYGFSDNWYDSSQLKGNIMALRLIVGGISIQPCNPTFITARDAILKFDEMIYKSKNNKCLIWAAFSKRGLGPKAKETLNGFKNDFGLPGGCSSLKG